MAHVRAAHDEELTVSAEVLRNAVLSFGESKQTSHVSRQTQLLPAPDFSLPDFSPSHVRPGPTSRLLAWKGCFKLVAGAIIPIAIVLTLYVGPEWYQAIDGGVVPPSKPLPTLSCELPLAARIVQSHTHIGGAKQLLHDYTLLAQADTSISVSQANLTNLSKLVHVIEVEAEHTYCLYPPAVAFYCSKRKSVKSIRKLPWVLQQFVQRSTEIVNRHVLLLDQMASTHSTLSNDAAREEQSLKACKKKREKAKTGSNNDCEALETRQSLANGSVDGFSNASEVWGASTEFWKEIETSAGRMAQSGILLATLMNHGQIDESGVLKGILDEIDTENERLRRIGA